MRALVVDDEQLAREEICFLYAGWLVIEIVSVAWRPGRLRAFPEFVRLWRESTGPPR